MGNLGTPELLIILVLVVLLFGWNRLPQIGKGLGEGIRNFKTSLREASEPEKKSPESETKKSN